VVLCNIPTRFLEIFAVFKKNSHLSGSSGSAVSFYRSSTGSTLYPSEVEELKFFFIKFGA